MSEINNIKKRLGRNSFNRTGMGCSGISTQGEQRRSRSVSADHKRNLAKQFGYPETITLRQHWDMANHNGIGSNLCYGIVSDCWRINPVAYDGDEDPERRKDNPTEFEVAFDALFERLDMWQYLEDLDYEQRPMRYGALMMITSGEGGAEAKDPLNPLPSVEYLVGLNVYNEAQLQVQTAGQDINTLSYGMPLTYQVRTNVAGSTNEWENSGIIVDASRVYAYGEGAIGRSIYGVPALEAAFESLMDLTKIRGSGAEGFYQNASNKYSVKLDKDSTIADAELILDSMEDFDNDISRSMVTTDAVSLMQTTLIDPTPAWTNAFNEACASESKPAKMVIGNQTGERSSTEDITAWNRVIMDRQSRQCNRMIQGFIDYITVMFNFPEPTNKLNIVWRDLNESTTGDKVDLGLKRAQTNKTCVDSGMQPVYSTEYIQSEAGAPVEEVVLLDTGGEDELPVDTVK